MLFTSAGMTTRKWKRIKPVDLPINWIKPSQGYVSIQILRDIVIGRYKEAYGRDEYPHVVKQDNVFWLEDGHHRYIIGVIKDEPTLRVRVLDNDGDFNGKLQEEKTERI